MKQLIEIQRERYGHDECAINLYSSRLYRLEPDGNRYLLSLTLDGCPPFFEAYGPFGEDHEGVLPRLRVAGHEYWGDGWSWSRALLAFCREIGAEIPAKTTH